MNGPLADVDLALFWSSEREEDAADSARNKQGEGARRTAYTGAERMEGRTGKEKTGKFAHRE